MHLLYEEGGDIRAATVISSSGAGDAQSWQVTAVSGKHLKLKAKDVWLQFEVPDAQTLITRANQLAQTIDLQLLWDCAPDDEFLFSTIAKEYFGDAVVAEQFAALAIALQAAPVYFRRKGRGKFMRAPLEQLQAGLAAIERKKKEYEQQERWQDDFVAGQLPEALRPHVNALLFSPDKNSLAYKAFHSACEQTGEHPAQLMMRCGALDSPLTYHHGYFLRQHFPSVAGFSADFGFDAEAFNTCIKDLPVAEVKAFSIDDAGTTEIDDALSLSAIGRDCYRLGIHIAAPGLLIQKDDRFDQLARQRMSTVYFPGDKITMPPDIFINFFSLDEGKRRPTISLYVEINSQGDLLDTPPVTKLELVHIEKNLRLDDLEHRISEEALADQASDLPYQKELSILWALARQLHSRRQEQRAQNGLRIETLGVTDPNALARDFHFRFSADRQTVEIEPRIRGSILDSIVAECMILCNRIWGQLLADHGLPALFRTQKGWGPQRTRMQTTPGPHEGLGVDFYAWCTSPLRRYADLVNQWQLIALTKNGVTAKMVAPFVPKDATLMGIAADFENVYQQYGEHQDKIEKYWCLRWINQKILPTSLYVRHLKEGMARVEQIPLHLPIPELSSRPRMTRAKIEVMDIDLLQLTAVTRLLEVDEILETVDTDASSELETGSEK